MKPFKHDITAKQQQNIRDHVDFLCFDERVTAERFDMESYGDSRCETAACSAGWMKVSMSNKSAPGNTLTYFGIDDGTEEWLWCFSIKWIYSDNTAVGAAARLLYLLEYGLPENWMAIRDGKAPYPDRILAWIEKVKAMKLQQLH